MCAWKNIQTMLCRWKFKECSLDICICPHRCILLLHHCILFEKICFWSKISLCMCVFKYLGISTIFIDRYTCIFLVCTLASKNMFTVMCYDRIFDLFFISKFYTYTFLYSCAMNKVPMQNMTILDYLFFVGSILLARWFSICVNCRLACIFVRFESWHSGAVVGPRQVGKNWQD